MVWPVPGPAGGGDKVAETEDTGMVPDVKSQSTGLVGVLPAAGNATRLGTLPCSKEILPVGIEPGSSGAPRVRVAIDCALEAFRAAGIRRVVIVLTPEKSDIRRYLGDGADRGMDFDYQEVVNSPSSAWSVSAARPAVGDANTALAFPDIQFRPENAIRTLADARSSRSPDLSLALVPSLRGEKVDLVEADERGVVSKIRIKPGPGQQGWTWVAAVWGPRFGRFLADAVSEAKEEGAERHVGDYINAAMDAGLDVDAVRFPAGTALDIGTHGDLAHAWAQNGATDS